MPNEKVSLELLVAKAKRKLGLRIEAVVEKWVAQRESDLFYSSEQLEELQKIVKEEMNVNVEFAMHASPYINASVGVIRIPGHSGSSYFGPGTKPVTVISPKLPTQLRTLKIDLDKGRVSGEIVDDNVNRLTLYTGLIQHSVGFTAEEITAVILHELGHVFNQFMALGDYVWLNYYLQDGVEVLLGTKPNIYKLEILTEAGLEKYCDDKEALAAVKAAPTQKNVRRAILMAFQKAPRHHLTSSENLNSLKREEQLADMFTSRMGYARAGVTGLAKMHSADGSRYTKSKGAFVFGETCRFVLNIAALTSIAAMFVMPPALLLATILHITAQAVGVSDDPLIYDNDIERLNKYRRDLVAQLRALGNDPTLADQMLVDLKMIDDTLAVYRKNTTLWEAVMVTISPETRRNRHQRAREEDLEQLLNNDLVVAAAKFNAFSRKLS